MFPHLEHSSLISFPAICIIRPHNKLKPGVKLEEITWKDDDLWYLTRPMRDNESAETHTFDQSTDFGFEGQVIIIEKNK